MAIEDDPGVDHTLWEPLPDVPHAPANFRGYAVASVRNTIYVSGGNSRSHNGGDAAVRRHKSLLSYDMTARKWTTLPDMVRHRWGHGLAVLEGGRYLFAIGGWGVRDKSEAAAGGGGDGWGEVAAAARRRAGGISFGKAAPEPAEWLPVERLASYEVYDVTKRQWRVAGALGEPRRDFALSIHHTSGRVYVFGGAGAGGDALSSAEVYDPHIHAWRPLPPMPRACRRCHALHVGNRVHVFEAGKTTLTYDTVAEEWSDKPPDEPYLPLCPRRGHVCSSSSSSDGAAYIAAYNYVVAAADGRLASRWMIAHVAQRKRRSRSWTTLPPADAFAYHRTAVANGKLVVAVGNAMVAFQVVDDDDDESISQVTTAASSVSSSGSTHDKSSRWSTRSSQSSYEIEPIKDDGMWKVQPGIASKPPDFRGYAVASAGNKVFISGGFNGNSSVYKSFLSYDVKKKTWKTLTSMTHRRMGHRMVASRDGCYIYVLGGGDGRTMRSLGIEIYDVKKKSWTTGPAMNIYRCFFGITECLGKLLVFGGVGSNNGNELGSVEFYDPKANHWKYANPLPEVRGVCNVISIGHVVYVFGTPSQSVLAYDIIAGEWLDDAPARALPEMPPGGCICASSSYEGGEVIVKKHPVGNPPKQRRTAHVYDASKKVWSSVHLLDEFACYSAVVASDKIVVVTPQNKLMAHCVQSSTSG